MNSFKYISFLIFVTISSLCFAQKTVDANGEYTLRIEKNWTEDFAVNTAKEKAKINAIENAFGSVVTQGNAVYVKDITTGNKTITSKNLANPLLYCYKGSFYGCKNENWLGAFYTPNNVFFITKKLLVFG